MSLFVKFLTQLWLRQLKCYNKKLLKKKTFLIQYYQITCQPVNQAICIFIIIIKKDWQCKTGRGRLPPYQSEDPSPTLPTNRGKEEKGKIVEDKKVENN